MDFVPEVLLPTGDATLQLAHLPHQVLEAGVQLDLQGVVGDALHPLLDEREYPDLLVFVEHPVLIQIEDLHELLQRGDLG